MAANHTTAPPSPLLGAKRKAGPLTSDTESITSNPGGPRFVDVTAEIHYHHHHHPRKYLRIEIPSTSIPVAVPDPDASAAGLYDDDDDEVVVDLALGLISPEQQGYSPSSLFSALSSLESPDDTIHRYQTTTTNSATGTPPQLPTTPARLTAPPIPGLHFHRTLRLPLTLSTTLFKYCMSTYFHSNPSINQVMLFTRGSATTTTTETQLPSVFVTLLTTLESLLRPYLPIDVHRLLFLGPPSEEEEGESRTASRQVILNLYTPGQGISPHIDLLNRFGDGIIGVSLGSGCVMRFTRAQPSPPSSSITTGEEQEQEQLENTYDLYLPNRSILILSADARYKWTHGIAGRKADFVAHLPPAANNSRSSSPQDSQPLGQDGDQYNEGPKGHWIDRGVRLSLTFRWLLPGADIVGSSSE